MVEPFQTMGDCKIGAPISSNCSTFLTNQLSSIQSNTLSIKDQTFTKALGTAQQSFDSVVATTGQRESTQNLASLSTQTNSANQQIKNMYTHDADLSKRQFQINEYHYNNKLEFLFFLQLLFISVLVMAILVYLNRNGSLTTQMTAIATMTLAVLVLIVGASRYFYTRRTRDRNMWNRRYFANEDAPSKDLFPSTCGGPTTTTTINMDALVDPRTTQCALEANDALTALQEATNTEVKNFMKGEDASSLWATSLTLGANSKCKK